jgi:hypothetical protein
MASALVIALDIAFGAEAWALRTAFRKREEFSVNTFVHIESFVGAQKRGERA